MKKAMIGDKNTPFLGAQNTPRTQQGTISTGDKNTPFLGAQNTPRTQQGTISTDAKNTPFLGAQNTPRTQQGSISTGDKNTPFLGAQNTPRTQQSTPISTTLSHKANALGTKALLTHFFRGGLVLWAGMVMQGCAPPTPEAKGLTYLALPKVPLGVSGVSVSLSPCVRENNPLAILPMGQMLKQWAADHWDPRGGRCQMIFHVKNFHIKEEVLACKFTPERWIRVENSDVYKAKIIISCILQLPNGQRVAKTDFTLSQEGYVPENYTLTQRKELWNEVYEGLINQLTVESNAHVPAMIVSTAGDL